MTDTPTTVVQDLDQGGGSPPTTPVAASPAGGTRGGRARWFVALGGGVAVVAATAAIVLALVGKAPASTVVGYVPSGSVMYAEARLDLPGDQRQQLGGFLSKFPGFADQSTLQSKLEQTLDKLVAKATSDQQTYTKDIEPWFGGQLGLAVGALPDAAALAPSTGGGSASNAADAARVLVVLSVKDATGATAWFAKVTTDSHTATTTESYGGTTITKATDPRDPGAWALVDGKVAVIGDITSVKAAIDTHGSGGFASEAGPKAALAAPTADHVGFVYADTAKLYDWSSQMGTAMAQRLGAGSSLAPTALSSTLRAYLPDWAAGWLRFEGDALVIDGASAHPASRLGPTQDRTSDVVKHVPGTALVAAVSHDVGATLLQALDVYRAEPSLKDAVTQLEDKLRLVGGAPAALGWIGDTAFVVDRTGDTSADAGIVILPTDAKAARNLSTSLSAFLGLAGAQQGVTIRTEDHAGTTISIVEASGLFDGAQSPGTGAANLPSGPLTVAWAVTDQVAVVGLSPAFVERVLDTTDATSLASNARYGALTSRVGAGVGGAWLDLAGIRSLLEGLAGQADASALKDYQANVEPYLAPFDALAASSSVGGDVDRSTLVITVK